MNNRIFYFNFLRRAYLFTVKQGTKILGLNDTPHSIAMGVAIGMFVAFTPTIPLQMTISFFIAWAMRVNKAASLPPAWVTNPVTAPPVFFAEYLTGVYLMKMLGMNIDVVGKDKFAKGMDAILALDLFKPTEMFPQILDLIVKTWDKIGPPLLVGSLIWSTIIGIAFYFITSKYVKKRRETKRLKLEAIKAGLPY